MKRSILQQIEAIVIKGDPDVLQDLYRKTQQSMHLTQSDIMKVWYGAKSLDSCSNEQLSELAAVLGIVSEENVALRGGVKSDFIASLGDAAQVKTKVFFENMKNAENAHGCDLACMSKETLCEAISSLGYYNRGNARQAVVYPLNLYIKWRKEQGMQNAPFWDTESITIEDIDISDAIRKKCVGSPEELFIKLKDAFPLDDGYMAPPALVLAWLGFTVPEMIDIEQGEVMNMSNTLRGRPVPPILRRILLGYARTVEVKRDNRTANYYLEDIGYYLKRVTVKPNGKRIAPHNVFNAVNLAGIPNVQDVMMSGHYYRLAEREKESRITLEDVVAEFGLQGRNWKTLALDRLTELQVFKSVFKYKT